MYIAYVCMYIHIVLCRQTVQVAKHATMFVHISTYVNGPVGIKNFLQLTLYSGFHVCFRYRNHPYSCVTSLS